jgi:excinuclease ABC subunit A
VVEHDEDIIKEADYVIDIGPLAGNNGGEVVFAGHKHEFDFEAPTLTARYMRGDLKIEIPKAKAKPKYSIQIKQAYKHNLKRIDVELQLFRMNVITGVSGSGKSTLVREVLYPSLQNKIRNAKGEAKNCMALEGDFSKIKAVEYIDQNPIGRSSRSNPVTYIKAYDAIRSLFSGLQLSKQRGYTPAFFSFNVDGGRCETCKGDGFLTVEMQFMADLHLECDECKGTRFKREMLDVQYKEKSIADVLNMTIDEALEFFEGHKDITKRLQILQDVGLGYLGLGQSSNTLSGGEAQRIKLAYFLAEGSRNESMLFIFDEPTTGLHFHDIKFLLAAFEKLIEQGHTLLVIEHNLEVIKCADWLIDLGPEGGKNGGNLVFQGPPKDILKVEESFTAKYLMDKLQ